MKFHFAVLLIIFSFNIFAQTEIGQTSDETTESDSIVQSLPKKSVSDSTFQNKNLRQEINKLVTNSTKREIFLPYSICRENFHFQSALPLNVYFRKNGFSVFPFMGSQIHFMQNYFPFYKIEYSENLINFFRTDYEFPVAFSYANLGLGDNDMNHAFLNFRKGNILGINKLHFNFNIITYDGLWLSEQEKAKNIDLQLLYKTNFGKFYFVGSLIDQKISSLTLQNSEQNSEISPISEKTAEYSFFFKNKIADLGVLFQNNKIDGENRKTWQFLLKKEIFLKNHYFGLSWENLRQTTEKDSLFNVVGITHRSEIIGFNWRNNLNFVNQKKYQANSVLRKMIFKNFYLQGKYSEYKFDIHTTKKSLGWFWQNNFLKSDIAIGLQKISQKDNFYSEMLNFLNFSISDFDFDLQSWIFYQKMENDDKNYPKWQNRTSFEITRKLKYENAISLGIKYLFCSAFDVSAETNNLNIYLKIKITPKFEISGEAVNILNNETLFGNEFSGIHFIANVKWIFVN